MARGFKSFDIRMFWPSSKMVPGEAGGLEQVNSRGVLLGCIKTQAVDSWLLRNVKKAGLSACV